ncbi:hypothetical protein R3P38DRAFT_2760811 [Favolaschia claudopus]|uniref:Uncharacterized protein n=1 Tax=Favolaschia claudopus TaxID=2862362 RepID=A0AAW0DXU5_9AGAR
MGSGHRGREELDGKKLGSLLHPYFGFPPFHILPARTRIPNFHPTISAVSAYAPPPALRQRAVRPKAPDDAAAWTAMLPDRQVDLSLEAFIASEASNPTLHVTGWGLSQAANTNKVLRSG